MKTNLPGDASPLVIPGTDDLFPTPVHCLERAIPMSGLPAPVRQLKIHSKYEPRGIYRYVIAPEIRLCGKWLASMGFACGEWVTVQPEPGRLVITLNKM